MGLTAALSLTHIVGIVTYLPKSEMIISPKYKIQAKDLTFIDNKLISMISLLEGDNCEDFFF